MFYPHVGLGYQESISLLDHEGAPQWMVVVMVVGDMIMTAVTLLISP